MSLLCMCKCISLTARREQNGFGLFPGSGLGNLASGKIVVSSVDSGGRLWGGCVSRATTGEVARPATVPSHQSWKNTKMRTNIHCVRNSCQEYSILQKLETNTKKGVLKMYQCNLGSFSIKKQLLQIFSCVRRYPSL